MPLPLSFAEYRATRHFPGLNGVRCLAIAAVIWHHSYYGPIHAFHYGFLGVDLFFVLSGFLIATLLRRERDATGTISLSKFWLRRCLRLIPALYLLLALLAGVYALQIGTEQADQFFGSLLPSAFYLSNWMRTDATNLSILWSLATEEQFYLVWPLIELFAHALAWPILIVLMLLNQFMNFGVLNPILTHLLPEPAHRYEIVAVTYMPICLGVLLARLAHVERGFAVLRATIGRSDAPWLATAGIALVMALAPADISGWPRLAVQLLMTALIGGIVLQPASAITRLLENRIVVRIGTVSYGMYLYHLWLMYLPSILLRRAGLEGGIPLFVLAFPLTVVVAELSYRLLERPMIDFSHRWHVRRTLPVAGTDETKQSS